MTRFLLLRLVGIVVVLCCVAFISFAIVSMFPGDYYTTSAMQFVLSGMSRSEAFQARDALRAAAGIDKPWVVQYFIWLRGVLRYGDIGVPWDYLFHPANGLAWTVVVLLSAALWNGLLAIPIGILSAVRKGTWVDHSITIAIYSGFAFPQYVWGWVIFWFVYRFINSDITGPGVWGVVDYTLRFAPLTWTKVGSHILHLIPAWIIIGAPAFAMLVRTLRAGLIDTWHERYLLTARGKGMSEARVVLRHAFRNALNPLISSFGLMFPTMIAGSMLASQVLGLPTFEWVFLDAVRAQDQRMITAGLLVYSIFLLVANLISDLALLWADPKVRFD